MTRRGFFGRLAAAIGLASLPPMPLVTSGWWTPTGPYEVVGTMTYSSDTDAYYQYVVGEPWGDGYTAYRLPREFVRTPPMLDDFGEGTLTSNWERLS